MHSQISPLSMSYILGRPLLARPYPIGIGLEQAPFVVFVYVFSSFEYANNLLIMGPNNTKNSSKSVFFSYLTINNIVRILLLL